jgi:hypothetical protein
VRFKIKEGGGYLGGELWDRGGPEEAIACGGCVRERERASVGKKERGSWWLKRYSKKDVSFIGVLL